jgi:hypothetical protein
MASLQMAGRVRSEAAQAVVADVVQLQLDVLEGVLEEILEEQLGVIQGV